MLFKTSDKVRSYAQLGTVNFLSLAPTIRMVEEQHIIPAISKELYTLFNTAYTAATDESTLANRYISLLDMCRCVIGPYLVYYYTPKAEIIVSDGGARREQTGTSLTAFQYQTALFREQNLREGEMAMEKLLQFLEDNKGDYAEWTGSSSYSDYRSLFIKSGGEFDKLYPSQSPYRNYQAMRAKMMDVEENNIQPALGSVLYDYLKNKDTTDSDLTDKEAALMIKLKKAIANFTVAYSIPFLSVKIDVNGITVQQSVRTSNDGLSARNAAEANALNALIKSATDAAQTWLANAIQYLNDNTADFSTGWPITPPVPDAMQHDEIVTSTPNDDVAGSYAMF